MKKTFALVLAVMMLLSSCFPAGAVTLQSVESIVDTVGTTEKAHEEAVLASAGTLVPGKNFFTGAATYETFEGYEASAKPSYFKADDGCTDYQVSEDTDLRGKTGKNKSFKFVIYDNYPQLYMGLPNTLDAGRKYYLSLEICSDAGSGVTNFWLMQQDASKSHVHTGYHDLLVNAVNAGEWLKFNKTITSVTAYRFYFQMGAASGIQKNNYFYADNFAFVPYYKVTYVGADTEYVLFADENDKDLSKLMTTYTVKSDNYPVWEGETAKLCTGWALEEGSKTPVTDITLANADITLYPIWEEFDFSVSCETPSVASDIGTTAVVTADEDVTWTVDVGNTNATYAVSDDGRAVTITSGGYAGEVTVKASPVSNPKISVTQKIAFVGGDIVRPGINIYTGTTSAYDFEGSNSKVVFHTASGTAASVYEDDNGKTVNTVVVREKDGDTENHAASLDGDGYYFYLDYRFPVIDKERPVKIEYDYILGLGGSQVRTLINYPTTYTGSGRENATFAIYLHSAQKEETWRHASVAKSTANQYKYSNGVVYYKGGEDLNFVSFINYSGAAQASYFDNVLCMPYYKVSYDLNGGNGVAESEYFLQDAGTSYTFKNTGAAVYKNGYAFKGWAKSADATAKDVITSDTVVLGEDITLYAVWEEDETVPDKYLVELYDGETLRSTTVVTEGAALTLPSYEVAGEEFLLGWKAADVDAVYGRKYYPADNTKLYSKWASVAVAPGANIFDNGDFEEAGVIDVRPDCGKIEIVDDNGNKVLKYTRYEAETSVQHYISWEEGRKYRISYKVKTPVAGNSFYNAIYADSTGTVNHIQHNGTAEAAWTTAGPYTYSFTADTDSFTFAPANTDAMSFFVSGIEAAEENVVYYDDLVCIPYYKVTYDANGGTGEVPADAQFLGTYTVDTETKPEREGYNFLGWTLKNGSVNLVSTVTPTENEDITLYAAWENLSALDAISYEFDSDKAGIANGVITVTQNDETADYTSAEVYLSDDDGILEDYTRFARFTFADGVGSYTISGNRAFPAEATRLAVKFIGEGLSDIYYWYTIPEEKRLVLDEEPVYTFWALSDLHLNGTNYNTDYWPEMPINRENAMRDVVSTDVDFAFINGDLICYGDTNYLKVLQSYLDDKLNNPEYNTNNIPFFIINGNHEYYEHSVDNVDADEVASYIQGQVDWLEENHGDNFSFVRSEGSNLWYAASNDKVNMIFLQNPEPNEKFTICDEQLKFLDEQLYNGENSSKTNLIICHSPVAGTIPSSTGFAGGIANSAAVKAILAKHPNTIVFSAHTHSDLSYEDAHLTVVNDMTTSASHINDGCLVWIDAWDGVGTDGAGHDRTFSTGVYVEVYEDKIYVKSRKFMADSMFFGHGVYIIDTPVGESDSHTVSMSGTTDDGSTFTALVDGAVPADNAGYTYEWTVGGKVVSTEKTYTVDIDGDYADEHVILRVTFADGSYASDISETAFDGVTVSYDANGGTGSVPKSHLWVPGYAVQPDIGSASPKMEGKFFIGWALTPDAVKPVAEVLIEDDTTLYAVYSDKPEFYFDANLSGFSSGNYISKIENGIVNTVSPGGDYYYNWSNGTIDAGTYKYMRIKSQYVSGSGDGMFFAVDNSVDDTLDKGITSDTRMGIYSGTEVAKTADGFIVREYNMSTNKYWDENATVTSLRFDVLGHGANNEVNIDYVVFSDKPGAYVVDITAKEGAATATASEKSNVTAEKAVWNGNTVTVTVAVKDGYTFTFADELEAVATINGCPVQEAVINDDGTAELTVNFDTVVVTDANITIGGSDETDLYYANFGKVLGECTVVAGAYNEKGRLLGTEVIYRCDDTDGVVIVNVAKSLGSDYVKAFAFENATSLKVIAEAAVSEGNLIVNGDAEGTETTALFSENGTVSIVNEAGRGNVWEVVPAKGTLYTYISQKFQYVAGATYKVTADIKLVGTSASNDVSGYINMNARYSRKDKTEYDHILNQNSCKAGEWKSVEYTFTIPADLDSKTNEQFAFYGNPITVEEVSYGPTYRVDNLEIHLYSLPE